MNKQTNAADPFFGLTNWRRDYLLWILVAACVVLIALAPGRIVLLPSLINWSTIATVAGLVLLATAVESSGALQHAARRLLARRMSERRLALIMVVASAAIAMVLTNDIALFVIVPLTLAVGKWATLPLRRLVIFEAMAVNAGALLTPIGNPQNIFLWQSSGVSFGHFLAHMSIPFAIAMTCLLVMATFAFRGKRVAMRPRGKLTVVDKPLLMTASALFVPFIVLADFHYSALALALTLAVFLFAFPRQLREVDWTIILVFVLMFVDLGLIAQYRLLQGLNLSDPTVLYLVGTLLPQVLSNVPTAILLANHHPGEWAVIAWAVNVGAFGTVVASMANLIAVRLGRQRGSLWALHVWTMPFFCVVGALVWLCLRWG